MAQPMTRAAPGLGSLAEVVPYAAATGRLLLSLIFVISGVLKFVNWQLTADIMAEKGIPLVPVALPAAALLEIAGGLSLLLGCWARAAGLALFVFLIPTTVLFHDFWSYEGEAMASQVQHFLKNLAIMGGLLLVAAFGPGPFSIDEGRADRR